MHAFFHRTGWSTVFRSDLFFHFIVKMVYSVTPEQVQQLTARYLLDPEMIIVIAGERKKIEKQIGQFGKMVG